MKMCLSLLGVAAIAIPLLGCKPNSIDHAKFVVGDPVKTVVGNIDGQVVYRRCSNKQKIGNLCLPLYTVRVNVPNLTEEYFYEFELKENR